MSNDAYDLSLQFLANLINERESKKNGYWMPVRWLCLRDDLRYKYLQEAKDMVDSWWVDEQKTGEVWVLNPKGLQYCIAREPEMLTEEDMHLVAYHLSRFIRATG